ncbi:MAG: ABC transporter permease [Armatimonadota bacterium]
MPWYLPVRAPLLWEELRRRFRGGRGQLVLLLYGLLLVLLLLVAAAMANLGDNPREWARFGKLLWARVLLPGQLAAMILLTPGLTAGAISMERERGTLDMLFLTPLASLTIVTNKFFGATGQMLMIVLSGLPVVSTVFLYGGVSPAELFGGYLLILVTGLTYAALGFLASCLFRRTTTAVVWSYGFMLLALIGLPVALGLLAIVNLVRVVFFETLLQANPLFIYVTFFLPQAMGEPPKPVLQILQPLGVMLLECAVIIVYCAVLVRKLRGVSALLPRRISLEAARFGSRPTHDSPTPQK